MVHSNPKALLSPSTFFYFLAQHTQERRRGQKQRQAAAREEQRRQTAAAAAVTDEEHYGQYTKNDPRRQNSAHHSFTLADGPPVRNNGYTPGASTVRPRSSSLTKNDDSYTRQGVSSLGDSNGSSGGGRPRLTAPGAGHVVSPAIRGFSRRSNRKLVRNAINFLCLAGGHLEKKKARVLEVLWAVGNLDLKRLNYMIELLGGGWQELSSVFR